MKSEWTTPKLIVLGRGTPEESVLDICKNHEDITSFGPNNDIPGCKAADGNSTHIQCQGVTGS